MSTMQSRAPAVTVAAPAGPAPLSAIALQTAAIIAVLAIPTLIALFLDERQINGVGVWHKPLKFEASLVVHLVTIGLLAGLLTLEASRERLIRWAYQITAFAALAEIGYIVLQSARGRASHFNFTTDFERTMYSVMGGGAVLIVMAAFVIGYALLNNAKPSAGRGLRMGGAWGLMLGAVATVLVGGVLSSGAISGPGHWVGGIHSDAAGLPLTDWSTIGGDLRVPHFFATHMMQAVPLLGLTADRLFPRYGAAIVVIGAIAFIGLVALTFAEAVAGIPFIRA